MIKQRSQLIDSVAITYSLSVAEHLGFRQAAAALGLSQSTLSRRVQTLEDHLQIAIFERGSRGSRLTLAGERFLARARATLDELQYAVATARASERGEGGQLKLGSCTSLSGAPLAKIIRSYLAAHPKVSIDLQENSSRALLTSIRERRLDIAFLTFAGQTLGCEVAELWNERVFVVLPKSHRLASYPEIQWAELEGDRFIATQSECGAEVHDHVLLKMRDLGHRPDVGRLPVARDSLLALVAMGFGVTLVTEGTTGLQLPGVIYRPLSNPPDLVTFSAAWAPENTNPALRQFISLAHVMMGRPRKGTSDWTGRAP